MDTEGEAGDAGPSGRPVPAPVASIEREELELLRRENRELKQANEILKLASAFSICAVLSEHGVTIAPRTYRKARYRPPDAGNDPLPARTGPSRDVLHC